MSTALPTDHPTSISATVIAGSAEGSRTTPLTSPSSAWGGIGTLAGIVACVLAGMGLWMQRRDKKKKRAASVGMVHANTLGGLQT